MSRRFLRHGAVLAGALLLLAGSMLWLPGAIPSGILAAQGPTAEENPFADSAKPDTKPAASSKPAAPAPANPFEDPFAPPPTTGKKPAPPPPTTGRAKPAGRSPVPPAASARGTVVQFAGGEAAIEKAMAATTRADFDQTPLCDVIEHFADLHRIPIVLDKRVLNDTSIDPSTMQVTYAGRAALSLRSVLDLILRPLGLTWTIRSEVLLITTEGEAENMLITRVYEVADLVRCRDEKDVPWDDYDSLIDAIEMAVEPDSWMDTGAGQGSVAPLTFGNARVLIVSNTYRVHLEIAKLLEDLRKIGAKAGSDQKPPVRERPKARTARGGLSGTIRGYSGPPPGPFGDPASSAVFPFVPPPPAPPKQ